MFNPTFWAVTQLLGLNNPIAGFIHILPSKSESEVTCGQVRCPILGICALHLTHPSAHTQQSTHTHTHTANTHPEQWAANAAAQLGVRCLAQGSHLSRGIEGGESTGYSLPPPTVLAGPETRTHDLRVTSPILYPLVRDCPTGLYLTQHFLECVWFFLCVCVCNV